MNQQEAARETLRQAKEVWPNNPIVKDHSFSLEHLEYMMDRMFEGMSDAKRGRWLGWMQAVVVAQTVLNLDDMKRINEGYSS